MYRSPKTEKGKETLNKIINASVDLISERGFLNTSISDITSKAGVAYGLFYFYFKSKHDILDELIRKFNRDMRYYLKVNTMGLQNRIEIEKVGMRKFLEWMDENKKYYKIFVEAQVHRPEMYIWHFYKLSERYRIGLQEAMNRGEIVRVDPELLSYVLIGIGEMLGRRYILWTNEGLTNKQLNDLDLLLSNMLKPKSS
ncbi:TetR family transcriptional regulator [Sulfolobus sp. A20]|uniref:TetR/AcrR family transcriptional regulator n=1 Tax=Saccharolobus sp. A20 TaxID=1891280 RepID=UPI0008461C0F|nr:TetR/AcrR family transcriptional regulator [Sulfolobus sp. A20]TRM77117.1 TetR/AcrR family transcriptional regulator [Sulfolobus sp. A20-N-F8]TRM88754.1 TetR/AcrR family transcriptional regulator [Sulfolobus sp. E3]TRM90360.1 TetR/AcrR family transcriptional regulator [Sulfolobus sp. A20-N-G8]TRM98443.1 TetR/AcrR family transcriptional regulator [Sulfolobus sp. E1]TRN03639.1 TetR/AcrR family transcriptional regulator [Sulfolobus sp. F1]